ncbi:hypothetical protein [Pseudomonas sp. BBP2017]|uniref:hypothetical protein n=1 Tax=Pseudomonas sp. BBP2017 TaxID=2109731 RepID=UPI000D131BC3|nr:hypothetical protein [Pseudomonas sp. BBP2017]PSS52772.1 hypothetical protein C6382_16440 [Pseudomonas sp. BBP2017]
MSTSSASRPDSDTLQAIVGLRNLILDPDEVRNGTNANIPQYAGKTEGDVITFKFESTLGPTFSTTITVDGGNANAPIPVRIAYEPYIIGNLDNDVLVIYEVKRQNGRTATSQTLSFLIKRQLEQNLVAPTVREASGNTLDPIQARNGATVRVAYTGMRPDDLLAVDWQGEGEADSYQSAQENGSASGYVDFAIPVSVVAASQGKTITVRYAIVRGGNPELLSKPLALIVGELPQSALPTPTVPEASAGTLDLTTFQGNATVNVQPWPLIAKGQRYWIVAGGTLVNGNPYSFYLAQSQLVDEDHVSNGLGITMLRSELEKLRSASSVSLEVKVAFEGGVSEAGARAFPTLTLTLLNIPRTLPVPTVPEAKSGTIEDRHTEAIIRVPATANLRAGEQVRGVAGGGPTSTVTVSQPGAALDLKVPVELLAFLASWGQTQWGYQVLVNGEWMASPTLLIKVLNTVSGNENWQSQSVINFVERRDYSTPSGLIVRLLEGDTHGGASSGFYLFQGTMVVHIVGDSKIRLVFPGSFKRVQLTIGALHATGRPINFFDSKGLIEGFNLPETGDGYLQSSYTFNQGRYPTSIEITGFRGEHPGRPNIDTGFVLNDIIWSAS